MQILLKVTPRPFSSRMHLGQLLRKYSKCIWTKTLQKFAYGQYDDKPILLMTNQYKVLKSRLGPLKESQQLGQVPKEHLSWTSINTSW